MPTTASTLVSQLSPTLATCYSQPPPNQPLPATSNTCLVQVQAATQRETTLAKRESALTKSEEALHKRETKLAEQEALLAAQAAYFLGKEEQQERVSAALQAWEAGIKADRLALDNKEAELKVRGPVAALRQRVPLLPCYTTWLYEVLGVFFLHDVLVSEVVIPCSGQECWRCQATLVS